MCPCVVMAVDPALWPILVIAGIAWFVYTFFWWIIAVIAAVVILWVALIVYLARRENKPQSYGRQRMINKYECECEVCNPTRHAPNVVVKPERAVTSSAQWPNVDTHWISAQLEKHGNPSHNEILSAMEPNLAPGNENDHS